MEKVEENQMRNWHVERVPDELDKLVREIGELRGENLRATVLRLVWDGAHGIRTESVRATNGARTPSVRTTDVPDLRHAIMREFIKGEYLKKFKTECSWDGSEARALGDLLKANPNWTAPQMEAMVRNRFESVGVTGDRPRAWLASLSSWVNGPQDRFKQAGDTRQQEMYKKPPPMVRAMDIKLEQEAEARRKGEIE